MHSSPCLTLSLHLLIPFPSPHARLPDVSPQTGPSPYPVLTCSCPMHTAPYTLSPYVQCTLLDVPPSCVPFLSCPYLTLHVPVSSCQPSKPPGSGPSPHPMLHPSLTIDTPCHTLLVCDHWTPLDVPMPCVPHPPCPCLTPNTSPPPVHVCTAAPL